MPLSRRSMADYTRPGGLQVVEVAGGYQIVTRAELHDWVRKLFHERTTQKLSVQSLETLAVIAYKQPITAPEIAEIRGVTSSGGVLSTLIERKLIKTVGRKQVIGRPFMYATTREFLERFGLNDLNDLPKVEEMSDALGFELPSGLIEPSVSPNGAAVRGRRTGRQDGPLISPSENSLRCRRRLAADGGDAHHARPRHGQWQDRHRARDEGRPGDRRDQG